MFNLFDYVPILPAALLIATVICLPLHVAQLMATDREKRRIGQRAAPVRVPRSGTVPSVAQRRTRRDQ